MGLFSGIAPAPVRSFKHVDLKAGGRASCPCGRFTVRAIPDTPPAVRAPLIPRPWL